MNTKINNSLTVIGLVLSALLFFTSIGSIVFAQTNEYLDSLYTEFVNIKSGEDYHPDKFNSSDKCGFDIINQTKLNINNFSNQQKIKIKSLLARPVLQTSIVSPSGYFRIHYDVTGSNKPAYIPAWSAEQNVAEVANVLDSVYRFEIDFLGYLVPPQDNSGGGDNKYDVYIVNQGGVYGYTEWENKVGTVNWTSFMVVDNDYVGFYSQGMQGLKVTAAHEFHHGIQVGNYAVLNSSSPYRNSDLFLYELTSTSMEEFVYNDVNDYYAYMSSYFSNPGKALPLQNGYNVCIWNLYLKERFGFDVIRMQWEMIPTLEAMRSIENSLVQNGSSFKEEFNSFGIWTYFTNSRAIPGVYFNEAANYPLISLTSTLSFTPPITVLNASAHPAANNFYKINLPTGGDFLISLITNGDTEAALQNPNQFFSYTYSLFNYNASGSTPIVNNYYYMFESSNGEQFRIDHIFNNIAAVEDKSLTSDYRFLQNYPNPFNPSTIIQYQIPERSYIILIVYDVLGKEIATLVNEEKPAGNYEIEFEGSELKSGIYFYRIQAQSFTETKKMILLR
jgi:hypothetical protein